MEYEMKKVALGTLTADIGPKEDNPRNSEGTFLQLADGVQQIPGGQQRGSGLCRFEPDALPGRRQDLGRGQGHPHF